MLYILRRCFAAAAYPLIRYPIGIPSLTRKGNQIHWNNKNINVMLFSHAILTIRKTFSSGERSRRARLIYYQEQKDHFFKIGVKTLHDYYICAHMINNNQG